MILGLFPQLLGSGGIQRIGRHTAASLASFASLRGELFRCVSFNDPPGFHRLSVAGIEYEFQGCGRSRGRLLRTVLASATRVSKVYLGHAHLTPLALLLKALRPSLKYWVAIYGIDVWTALPFWRRLGLRAASGVSSVCRFTAERAAAVQGVPLSKFTVIPPAIDPIFQARCEITSDQEGMEKANHVLLTVCRLDASEQYKGVDTVIRALPKIRVAAPDVSYVLVGDGDDRARLERLAEEVNVKEHVVFAGVKDTDELPEYYRRCDVFLMPSRAEGWASVYMEAMLYEKPAIGCHDGGTPEVIVDGETGYLVPYDDADVLAERVIRLLQDAELRREMGRAGRRRVEENFTFEHLRQRLFRLVDGNGQGEVARSHV